MKHLKKFLAVALVCVMALTVLTGCGKSTKDYQKELSGKLTSANIGVVTDDNLNKGAELIVKAVSNVVSDYLKGKNIDIDKIIEDTAKKANLPDDTKAAFSISGWGQIVNEGFDGNESTSTKPASDFFVDELRTYNASHTEKLTKVGVAVYKIPATGIDVVILIATK